MNQSFSVKDFVTALDDTSTCTSDENIGQVLHLVNNSHDAVFVMDKKNNLRGLINPYQELYKKRHPYSTKVASVALVPAHFTVGSSIFEVARFMLESRIYRLPIFSDPDKANKKIIGRIDVKDLLKILIMNKEFVEDIAKNLKPSNSISIHKKALVRDVYNILRKKEISRIILVDDQGQVSGIISRSDIQKAFISPTTRQRFHKENSDFGNFMFDEEEITRRDEPISRYETQIVSTIQKEKPLKDILRKVITSNLDDIVIVDKASKPTGILTTRDILQALIKSQSEYLPNIIIEKPKKASQKEIELIKEFLIKFIRKINKISLVNKVEISFKESQFLTGEIAEYNSSLRINFLNGKNYVATTHRKQLLVAVKESIKELEKQISRDKDQIDHHNYLLGDKRMA